MIIQINSGHGEIAEATRVRRHHGSAHYNPVDDVVPGAVVGLFQVTPGHSLMEYGVVEEVDGTTATLRKSDSTLISRHLRHCVLVASPAEANLPMLLELPPENDEGAPDPDVARPAGGSVEYESNFLYNIEGYACLLYTSPSPRDATLSRMPSSA